MPPEASAFVPDWISPPCDTIAFALEKQGMDVRGLDQSARWSLQATEDLLFGWQCIDSDIADVLSNCLGASKDFWLKRQSDFEADLARALREICDSDAKEFLSTIPIAEMKRFGWVPSGISDLELALRFFSVASPKHWSLKYEKLRNSVAFRQSLAHPNNPQSTLAWLRQAERAAALVPCKTWDKCLFESNLAEIRKLTNLGEPERFFPKLVQVCAQSGVAVVFVRTPSGCRASGATKFISPHKAMIVLSFRHLSDDHFWFTFFHEAAHLILHDQKALFIEDDSESTTEEEIEANQYAENALLPKDIRKALDTLPKRSRAIIRFSVQAGVSAGIVVGQMQHKGILSYNQQNKLKRRFSWKQLDDAF